MAAPVRPSCFQQIRAGIQRCTDAARRQITRLCCCSSAPAAAAAAAAPAPAPIAAAVAAVAGPAIAVAPAAPAASAPRPNAALRFPDEFEAIINGAAAPIDDDPDVLEGMKRKRPQNLVHYSRELDQQFLELNARLLETYPKDSAGRLAIGIDIGSVQICLRTMVPPGAAAAPRE